MNQWHVLTLLFYDGNINIILEILPKISTYFAKTGGGDTAAPCL
jgi:hypothetical protein